MSGLGLVRQGVLMTKIALVAGLFVVATSASVALTKPASPCGCSSAGGQSVYAIAASDWLGPVWH